MELITELSVLCEHLRRVKGPLVVAIEGFTSSGKSHLANYLGKELCFSVIHTDEFIIGEDESLPYTERLDYERLRLILDENVKRLAVTLFEGICARESLCRLGIRAELFIYVKCIGENGLWYDGFQLDDFEAEQAIYENFEEPHFSDFSYHIAAQPHKRADVVFERVQINEP